MFEAPPRETVDLQQMGRQAQAAAVELAQCSTAQKNEALLAIAQSLDAGRAEILAVNAEDMAAAREAGTDELFIRDRLNLERRMDSVIADLHKVAELPDPVGERFDAREPRDGLRAWKQRTPLGVLGVIYEARPQVTVDVAALALKTGNAVILRGGREVLRSNMALVRALSGAMQRVGLPAAAFQYIASSDRALVGELLRMHQYVDMIIPRGGNGLHNFCREHSTIPVITGGIGICHLYVEPGADLDSALQVIHNSKTVSPAVCNALDTLLVHRDVAQKFLPRVVDCLGEAKVAFRAEPRALACARDNLERLGLSRQVEVVQADLFPEGRVSLAVCNPPWLPARPSSPVEHAVYDPDSRMLRGFLNGLTAHLTPNGEGWLILSDLAEHLGLRTREQLLDMIQQAGLRVVERIDTRPTHGRAKDPSDPLHAARSKEVTSLWRLAAA